VSCGEVEKFLLAKKRGPAISFNREETWVRECKSRTSSRLAIALRISTGNNQMEVLA
jgi:hypothetical protein